MTGVGRSTRVGSKPPPPKGKSAKPARTGPGSRTKAALARTTQKKGSSTSMRTRSLPPLATPVRGKGRPASRGRPAAMPAAAPMTSVPPAKQIAGKKSGGRGRRPKFQDNPPAPEIVEKKALNSDSALHDEIFDDREAIAPADDEAPPANGHKLQADEESEEEVDDVEPSDLEMEDEASGKKRTRDEVEREIDENQKTTDSGRPAKKLKLPDSEEEEKSKSEASPDICNNNKKCEDDESALNNETEVVNSEPEKTIEIDTEEEKNCHVATAGKGNEPVVDNVQESLAAVGNSVAERSKLEEFEIEVTKIEGKVHPQSVLEPTTNNVTQDFAKNKCVAVEKAVKENDTFVSEVNTTEAVSAEDESPTTIQDNKTTALVETFAETVKISMEALLKPLNKHLKRAVNRLKDDQAKVIALKKQLLNLVQEVIPFSNSNEKLDQAVETAVLKFENTGKFAASSGISFKTLQLDSEISVDELVNYLTDEIENEYRKAKTLVPEREEFLIAPLPKNAELISAKDITVQSTSSTINFLETLITPKKLDTHASENVPVTNIGHVVNDGPKQALIDKSKLFPETDNVLKSKPVHNRNKKSEPEAHKENMILVNQPGHFELTNTHHTTPEITEEKAMELDSPPPPTLQIMLSPGARCDGAVYRDDDSENESSSPVTASKSSVLRKVRVNRSRNSLSKSPEIQSTLNNKVEENKGTSSPSVADISHSLTSPQLYSALAIEIPKNQESTGQTSSSRLSPAARTKQIKVKQNILSKNDAETAAGALPVIFMSPGFSTISVPQPLSVGIILPTPHSSASPLQSNRELSESNSPQQQQQQHQHHQQETVEQTQQPQASLKTVIRVPKPMPQITTTAISAGPSSSALTLSLAASSSPEISKKKRKKKNLSGSDGGIATAEEDEFQEDFQKKKQKNKHLPIPDIVNEAKSPDEGNPGQVGKESADTGEVGSSNAPLADEKLAELVVVPEKISSFKIHPERCCSDVCRYCRLKFGIFDTPMHLTQLKTPKIVSYAVQFTGFSPFACLCEKCFRFLDRKAKNREGSSVRKLESKGDGSSNEASGTDERATRCLIRNCNRKISFSVSKKWLIRLKKKLIKQVSIDWEQVAKAPLISTFSVCPKHSAFVLYFMSCGLCKQKLSIPGICTFGGITYQQVQELNRLLREDQIPAGLAENMFLCKFCKTFCGIKLKATQTDCQKPQKNTKSFYRNYRSRLMSYLGLDCAPHDDLQDNLGISSPTKKVHQVSSQSDNPTKITIKTTTLKVSNPSSKSNPQNRKRRTRKFASLSSESRIHVTTSEDPVVGPSSSLRCGAENSDQLSKPVGSNVQGCSVHIEFDPNTKKLWQDLHYPFGNYTTFFRHLILLENYWRSGDLALTPNASQKSSAYIQSVHNRIEAYDEKHKRSEFDLSSSTLPDFDITSPSPLVNVPVGSQNVIGATSTKAKQTQSEKETQQESPPGSTILKIPKVPHVQDLVFVNEFQQQQQQPTKIRVRTDLMHLGLMANSTPNVMVSATAADLSSNTNKANQHLSVKDGNTTPGYGILAKSPDKSNLMLMLNDPPLNVPQMPKVPIPQANLPRAYLPPSTSIFDLSSGNSSLVNSSMSITSRASNTHVTQSSNSKLFKNSGESSAAIPLTFNNSIAEVLTAAKKNAKSKVSPLIGNSGSGGRAEVTITAKPFSKQPTTDALPNICDPSLLSSSMWSGADGKTNKKQSPQTSYSMTKPTNTMHSASANRGQSIQQKSSATTSSSHQQQQLQQHQQQLQQHQYQHQQQQKSNHPLVDISKLLQNKPSGHAQQSMTLANTLNIPSPHLQQPLSLSKPSSHMNTTVTVSKAQSSTSSGAGIQTVDKKSLNNVLDRLSGLKATEVRKADSPRLNPSGRNLPSVSSSLVQQLQSPPMLSGLGGSVGHNVARAQNKGTASEAQQSGGNQISSAANQLASMSGMTPSQASMFLGLQGTAGLIGQPMVQYPWASHQAQAQQAAQAALLLAGAGMPGMNQAAAAAAMHELIKISMSQQNSQQQNPKQQQQSMVGPRVRAPPPLTHMGRLGPSNTGNQ